MMADNLNTDNTMIVFFNYTEYSMSGSYSVPTDVGNNQTVGTKSITATTKYYMAYKIMNSEWRIVFLASATSHSAYNYKYIIDIPFKFVRTEFIKTTYSGNALDAVSCQITGDFIVYTYRILKTLVNIQIFPGVKDRVVGVIHIPTQAQGEFHSRGENDADDLKITDESPLLSGEQRWKLLTAIGIIE
jgi:hypothetical protein